MSFSRMEEQLRFSRQTHPTMYQLYSLPLHEDDRILEADSCKLQNSKKKEHSKYRHILPVCKQTSTIQHLNS